MFHRANHTFEAEHAASKQARPALEKQLFPSSSPSNQRDGDIAESFRKPSATARATTLVDPLRGRSVNMAPPPPKRHIGPVKSGNLASLYQNSASFKDGPEVIDLINDSKTADKSFAQSIAIDLDDFSDDENLDLSFVVPSALPVLPASIPRTTTVSQADFPPTNISAASWSSSPPSHYRKPQRQVEITTETVKRASPENSGEPVRAAKKRALPKDWQGSEKDDIEELYLNAVTPAPKEKSNKAPWDTTASGIKAQKKQFKDQHRAPAATGFSGEDMQEVISSRAPPKAVGISLSNEQRHVKDLVVEQSKSVFFTGPAGTGKSVLMRAIIKDMHKKYARDRERVAVTASTGLAACNIGGMTLHSFAGIGLGKEDAATLIKKIRRNPKAKNRWIRTKVLIIDEVSMLDGELFDKLSQIGRTIRNNGRPWGGIQLVITGDFFQLPPVPDSFGGNKARDIKFAFEANTWNTSIDHTIGLTEVFRQRDPVFAQMLNEMRIGQISEETVRNFRALQRPLRFDDDIEVTELFPTKNEVDSSNQRRLATLPGKSHKFLSMDTGDPTQRDRLLSNMMAGPTLEFKKGAQVMLIKNIDDTLVNGSLGKIVGFMSESTFELEGGGISDGEDNKFKKRMKAFSNALEDSSRSKGDTFEYPLVKFRAVDGTERTILCMPEEWKVELPTGEVQASRKQVPLILAWALSIHKAQGQTLERVKVDLGKVFEKGQAYVALSRATTQQGLQVLRFQKEKVMAHPRVVGFYNQLYSVGTVISKKKQTSMANFAHKPAAKAESQMLRNMVDLVDEDEEQAMSVYA